MERIESTEDDADLGFTLLESVGVEPADRIAGAEPVARPVAAYADGSHANVAARRHHGISICRDFFCVYAADR